MKVVFNEVTEFLAEAAARPPQDRIVRITQQFSSSKALPLKKLHVVATYCRDQGYRQPTVIQLSHYIGDAWPDYIGDAWPDGGHNKTLTNAAALVERLVASCKEIGLTAAAGVIEP